MIEGKSPEQIRSTFNLPDDLTEDEKMDTLAGIKVPDLHPRLRMLHKLYARRRRELLDKRHKIQGELMALEAAPPLDTMQDLTAAGGERGRGCLLPLSPPAE